MAEIQPRNEYGWCFKMLAEPGVDLTLSAKT